MHRERLSEAEWKLLVSSVCHMFLHVARADGVADAQEREALRREVSEPDLYESELAREVFATARANLDDVLKEAEIVYDQRKSLDTLAKVGRLLSAKFDQEVADDFRNALFYLGGFVAKASGGILGIGKVSRQEAAALSSAADALEPPTGSVNCPHCRSLIAYRNRDISTTFLCPHCQRNLYLDPNDKVASPGMAASGPLRSYPTADQAEKPSRSGNIAVGMSMQEVDRILGMPFKRMSAGDIYSKVAALGSMPLPRSEASKVFAIYKTAQGMYKIVFVNGHVAEVASE